MIVKFTIPSSLANYAGNPFKECTPSLGPAHHIREHITPIACPAALRSAFSRGKVWQPSLRGTFTLNFLELHMIALSFQLLESGPTRQAPQLGSSAILLRNRHTFRGCDQPLGISIVVSCSRSATVYFVATCTRQGSEDYGGVDAIQRTIAPGNFGKTLLKQRHVYLIASGQFGKNGPCTWQHALLGRRSTWQIVINLNLSQFLFFLFMFPTKWEVHTDLVLAICLKSPCWWTGSSDSLGTLPGRPRLQSSNSCPHFLAKHLLAPQHQKGQALCTGRWPGSKLHQQLSLCPDPQGWSYHVGTVGRSSRLVVGLRWDLPPPGRNSPPGGARWPVPGCSRCCHSNLERSNPSPGGLLISSFQSLPAMWDTDLTWPNNTHIRNIIGMLMHVFTIHRSLGDQLPKAATLCVLLRHGANRPLSHRLNVHQKGVVLPTEIDWAPSKDLVWKRCHKPHLGAVSRSLAPLAPWWWFPGLGSCTPWSSPLGRPSPGYLFATPSIWHLPAHVGRACCTNGNNCVSPFPRKSATAVAETISSRTGSFCCLLDRTLVAHHKHCPSAGHIRHSANHDYILRWPK